MFDVFLLCGKLANLPSLVKGLPCVRMIGPIAQTAVAVALITELNLAAYMIGISVGEAPWLSHPAALSGWQKHVLKRSVPSTLSWRYQAKCLNDRNEVTTVFYWARRRSEFDCAQSHSRVPCGSQKKCGADTTNDSVVVETLPNIVKSAAASDLVAISRASSHCEFKLARCVLGLSSRY